MSDVFPEKIRRVQNCILIPPVWWERIVLKFLEEHVFDGALHTIKYKFCMGWLWIISAEPKTVPQQKKSDDLMKGCGFFNPWTN